MDDFEFQDEATTKVFGHTTTLYPGAYSGGMAVSGVEATNALLHRQNELLAKNNELLGNILAALKWADRRAD